MPWIKKCGFFILMNVQLLELQSSVTLQEQFKFFNLIYFLSLSSREQWKFEKNNRLNISNWWCWISLTTHLFITPLQNAFVKWKVWFENNSSFLVFKSENSEIRSVGFLILKNPFCRLNISDFSWYVGKKISIFPAYNCELPGIKAVFPTFFPT